MDKHARYNYPFLVQCTLFLIPVNIYLIGNGLAAGIEWILFRYQQSYLGNSIILFYKYLGYISSGILTGRSAFAAGISFTASVLLLLSLILFLHVAIKKSSKLIKSGAILTIIGGLLFLISDMIQYGIVCYGPNGFILPVGVPCILVAGGWIATRTFPDAQASQ